MDQQTLIQNFLSNQNIQIPILNFLVNLILAAILGYILSLIYTKYGKSLSNRQTFARNFVLITVTTMLIISIVKSSLALSLGLVGALSIVRFRAAIKEPEELAYLFLSIAVGLGLGADQMVITLVAFAIVTVIIYLRHVTQTSEDNHNLHLVVSSHNPKKAELKEIIKVLRKHCEVVNLKRFDNTKKQMEASFQVDLGGSMALDAVNTHLQELGDD